MAVRAGKCFKFSEQPHSWELKRRTNATSIKVLLIEASQASDVGSIPIARSINLVDSVALPLLRTRKRGQLARVLDPTWPQIPLVRFAVYQDLFQLTHHKAETGVPKQQS